MKASYEKDGSAYCLDVLPLHDRLIIKNSVSATYNNSRMYMEHFACQRCVHNNNDEVEYKTFWSGMMYAFEYKKAFNGHIRVFPTIKNVMGNETNQMLKKLDEANEVKVENDNIWFNENFEVYSTNKFDAIYFLSPDIIQFLCEAKSHNILYSIYLDSGWIYISTTDTAYNTNSIELKPEQNYIRNLSVDSLVVNNKKIYEGAIKLYNTFDK